MLDLAHTTDVEITLITNRLPWLGHVALMPDERSIKALLYGEESSRRVGRPFLRFKGMIFDGRSSTPVVEKHCSRPSGGGGAKVNN